VDLFAEIVTVKQKIKMADVAHLPINLHSNAGKNNRNIENVEGL
jgi:hypothetical protein